MTGITLENPGVRVEKVTEDDATELIGRWTKQMEDNPNEVVTTVDLSNRTYFVAAMKIICDFLRDRVNHVKKALLHDIIASLPTEEGLEILGDVSELLSNSPVEHLDLDDNALGIRGVHKCKPIISLPSLQYLSLQNLGLSAESMQDIHVYMQNKQNLRTLRLYNNMIGVEGAKATGKILSGCDNLTYFRYEGCRPQPEGTAGIVDGLISVVRRIEKHPLKRLELEGSVQDESVTKLCNTLRNLFALTDLRLYDCSLDLESCNEVLKALQRLRKLESLDMSNNEMGAANVRRLAPVIVNSCATLKVIKLEGAELTSRGVEHLSAAFNKATEPLALEELVLTDNQIGTRGADALIAARNTMPNLRSLNLDENSFSDEVLEKLQNCFGDILLEMEGNEDDFDNDDDLSEDEEDDEEEDLEGVIEGMAKLTPDDVSL